MGFIVAFCTRVLMFRFHSFPSPAPSAPTTCSLPIPREFPSFFYKWFHYIKCFYFVGVMCTLICNDMHMETRVRASGDRKLQPPFGPQDLNSGCLAWQQVPLSHLTDPSFVFLLYLFHDLSHFLFLLFCYPLSSLHDLPPPLSTHTLHSPSLHIHNNLSFVWIVHVA